MDGGEEYGWVQQWLRKNEELYPAKETAITSKVSSVLTSLRNIKKDEVDERQFYELVLTAIKELENVSLTPEEFEELKSTLQEIGCKPYKEWKAEKEENGEIVVDERVGEGIGRAGIPTAVNFVSQLLYDHSNAEYALSKMLDGGEEYGWVQQWLKNSQDIMRKSNIPYYQAAKQALMNWNGLSEEEAEKVISTQTFEEVESQVYAKGSMDYAVGGIKKALNLSDAEAEELSKFVYEGGKSKVVDNWKILLELSREELGHEGAYNAIHNKTMFNNLIMDTLFAVHDGWVKDNARKFFARDKKHQHMPSELIGWKEVKADLLFVRPIFEAAGIEVNEEELEQVYNNRVKEFFLDRGIKTSRELSDSITQGEDFYPALSGQSAILVDINDPDYVDNNIIPAIEQKGIGKIEEIRANILYQIASNPTPEDLERLSPEEREQVEQLIEQEVDNLSNTRDELQQKNSIVSRIIALSKKREYIRKEIEIAENEKKKNTEEIGDN